MKKNLKDLFTRKNIFSKKGIAILAGAVAVIAIVSVVGWNVHQARVLIEIASSHIDEIDETVLQEGETPLASTPKVTTTTNTSTKKSSKKVSLSSAPTKTYTKTLPATTKKSTKTVKKNNSTTVQTTTTEKTEVTEKYTKKVKQKIVDTKVTTTVVTKTTVAAASSSNKSSKDPYKLDTKKAAPKMNSKVINAYTTLGFTTTVNPTVSYAGYFNAKNKTITLREDTDTIYHELGHFLGFIAGNYDVSSEFQKIYAAEKSKYTGYNKAYVNQNSAEYFAESVKDFMLSPSSMKSSRPKTYAAVEKALSKVTDAQIRKYKIILSAI